MREYEITRSTMEWAAIKIALEEYLDGLSDNFHATRPSIHANDLLESIKGILREDSRRDDETEVW